MFDQIKAKLASVKEKVVGCDWNKCAKAFFEKCRWFNIQLTTAFHVTTTVHWSVPAFLLLLLLVASPIQAGVAALALLCVVPHEYGHALAARWYGIKTHAIVLYPVGGVAMLAPNKEVKLEKWKEFVVAAAGPLVSLGLAFIGLVGMMLATKAMPANPKMADLSFWSWLFIVNFVMVVFNVIPAFPMDGGRMLRAIINLFTSHLTATKYAYYTSVVFCSLVGVLGLLIGNLMLPFMMFMINMMARAEYQQVQKQAALEAAAPAVPVQDGEEKIF